MYAIFNSEHKQVTNRFSNKTKAWDNYLEHNPSAAHWYEMHSETLSRLRKNGFFCDYAYDDMPKSKAKPKAKPVAKAPAVIKFEQKVEKAIVLDLAFARAMHEFFNKKQNAGEIKYIYEYKSYGSDGDAEKLLEHMTEFFNGYTV